MSKDWKTYEGEKTDIIYRADRGLYLKNDDNDYRTDYSDVLNLLHPDIEWKHIPTGRYQGTMLSLGADKEGTFYYKNNSYGSCSGCDWIYSIETEKQAEEFFREQETLDKIGKDINKVKKYLTKEKENVYDFENRHLNKFINFIENKVMSNEE